MNMMEKADDQKHFSWCCFLKPPLLLLVVTLIPSTAFFFFFFFPSSHGLVSSVLIMTITVLFISSSVLFHKFSKNKTRVCLVDEKPAQEEHPDELQVREGASAAAESQTRPCDAQGEAEMTDLPSDTESSSATVASEAFELDWVSCSRMVCDVPSSCFDDDHDQDGDGDGDGDDEDEDGLIEIALMKDGSNGLCDDPKDNKKHNLQKIWVEDGEEEINDVNIEEENLIEIDISIGSIKRPTVEI